MSLRFNLYFVFLDPCQPGYREERSICVKCPKDYYQDVSLATVCKECPKSRKSEPGSSTCVDKCESGFKYTTTCEPCGYGAYRTANVNQPDKCEDCPYPKTTVTNIAKTEGYCVCDRGFRRDASDNCVSCAKDTFQSEVNQTVCIQCQSGYGTIGIGQRRCISKNENIKLKEN